MKESLCPNCKTSHSFEACVKSLSVNSRPQEFVFIQCSQCGAVINILQTGIIGNAIASSTNLIAQEIRDAKFEIKRTILEKK